MQHHLKLGTRGSPLALAQAHMVRDLLIAAHDGALDVEVCVMSTRGDQILDRPLAEIGGKGLFTEEIEAALLSGAIDLAVHSTKDMPTTLPAGLALLAFTEREDPRDAFISHVATCVEDLPEGAIVGTASLRRQAQLLRIRPDLKVVSFRGNVQTRLRKLADGEVTATLLAAAGLNRLGLKNVAKSYLEQDVMLPAPAQGAVCIEAREGDEFIAALLSKIDHAGTRIAVTAERNLLAGLDGNCRTPIAALADVGVRISLIARVLSLDGQQCFEAKGSANLDRAAQLGVDLAAELRELAGDAFFAQLRSQIEGA